MICLNELVSQRCNKTRIISDFTILLSPYAPHISEEIWEKLGNTYSITEAKFPDYKEAYIQEEMYTYPISFNGKTKFTISLSCDLTKDEIEVEVMNHDKTKKFLDKKSPKKIIIVPKRIVNIVL